MIWVFIFLAWLVVAMLLVRYPLAGGALAPLLSAVLVGVGVTAVFGLFAGAVWGLWAWRLPRLWSEYQVGRLQDRRRAETHLLLVVLTNGVGSGKPVWTTLRDGIPRLPAVIRAEIETIVAASHTRVGYTPALGLEALGQRWHLNELEIAGRIARVSEEVVGAQASQAFGQLLDALEDRAARAAAIRKGTTQTRMTAAIFITILVASMVAVAVVPVGASFYVGHFIGQMVMGVASLLAIGGLSVVEGVWRRQEAAGSATV